MRKLKLQMQMSIDGFAAGPNGEMDWMIWDWDDELKKHIWEITKPVDCIILGRKLAQGFIDAWASRVNDPATNDEFAQKMNDTSKLVFSQTLEKIEGKATEVVNGDLIDEITKLKNEAGGDIIVYGGAGFVTSLIKNNLIDEYHLFINPVALGKGMAVFDGLKEKQNFKLFTSKSFDCGISMLHYESKTD